MSGSPVSGRGDRYGSVTASRPEIAAQLQRSAIARHSLGCRRYKTMLPTGWTIDALHKLISFQAGAMSAVPNVIALVVATVVVAWLAVR